VTKTIEEVKSHIFVKDKCLFEPREAQNL